MLSRFIKSRCQSDCNIYVLDYQPRPEYPDVGHDNGPGVLSSCDVKESHSQLGPGVQTQTLTRDV